MRSEEVLSTTIALDPVTETKERILATSSSVCNGILDSANAFRQSSDASNPWDAKNVNFEDERDTSLTEGRRRLSNWSTNSAPTNPMPMTATTKVLVFVEDAMVSVFVDV